MAPKYAGTTVVVRGGREMVLPPLTIRTLRAATKDNRMATVQSIQLSAMLTDEQWSAVSSLITDAFRPNYPDISQDEVEDFIDTSNLKAIIEALFSGSGFKRVPPGEAQSPSNGTISSPTSSP